MRIAAFNPFPGIIGVLIDQCQPKSKGNITINSSNPLDPPVINLREFSNPDDLSIYVQTFQIYIKNINNAFKKIDSLYQLIVPPPAILDDTELLTAYLK